MPTADIHRQIDLLARRERPRLVANLAARLGYDQLELAEDVAQEALMKALSRWPYSGMPDNPAAWLHRVSMNRAIDELRRRSHVRETGQEADTIAADATDLFMARIEDPELRLIFLCCQPGLPERDQLALTLQVASGFTAREIATLLLNSEDQVSQRLARLKRRLRQGDAAFADAPGRADAAARLEIVIQVLYLMFALGYGPRSGDSVIRRDVAEEAIRLALELADSESTETPEVHALAAVLCLQGSRLAARTSPDGEPVLLEHQDRSCWDAELINVGLYHLMESQRSSALTRLHLEAGIAACHATACDWTSTDWEQITWYYDELSRLDMSPVVRMNHAVAVAMSGRPEEAETMIDGIEGDKRTLGYAPYFIARAEIHKLVGKTEASQEDYQRALMLDLSSPTAERLRVRMAGAQMLC